MNDGLINRNPATNVEIRGADSVERAHLPAADGDKIAAHIRDDRLEGCWLLTINAGLRRSELMALRWSDLDLDNGWVHITRGRVRLSKDRDDVNKPKSKASKRDVPIGPDTIAGLKRMHTQRAALCLRLGVSLRDEDYIAVTVTGDPLSPEWYSDAWLDSCEVAGVPKVTLLGARHGSVTRMRNAGLPGHLVAAFHGHTEQVMAGTYSHAEEQELRRLAR